MVYTGEKGHVLLGPVQLQHWHSVLPPKSSAGFFEHAFKKCQPKTVWYSIEHFCHIKSHSLSFLVFSLLFVCTLRSLQFHYHYIVFIVKSYSNEENQAFLSRKANSKPPKNAVWTLTNDATLVGVLAEQQVEGH